MSIHENLRAFTNSEKTERVSAYELEEGETYVVRFGLYSWSSTHHDMYQKVEVTDIMGVQESGHMCDISLENQTGERYTYYTDNGYLSGDASFNDSTPDRTDIGKSVQFHKESNPSDDILADIESEFADLE